MKRFVLLALIVMAPASAAIPPGVVTRSVPGESHIKLYERPSPPSLPSFWESFFKLFLIPGGTKAVLPFGRSVAVLVGIGHYQFIKPELDYISRDVERFRDYALGDGGFDAVYVMDEGITPEMVETFMSDELPRILNPDDRLLFYYSGHGGDPGTGHPVLQFQRAQPGRWGQNVLRVDEFEQWSGLLKAKHALFLFDACTAGEAVLAKGPVDESRAAVAELSGNGSRTVVTAGTANQQAWVMSESANSQYSIFTEALLRVLRDGTAESNRRGFITIGQAVSEAEAILAAMTRHLGPGHTMNPSLVKIDSKYTGTFVFLNPHAHQPQVSPADMLTMGISLSKGSGGGNTLDKELELAYWKSIDQLDDPQLYAHVCEQFPNGLFCPIAQKRLEKFKAAASKAAPSRDLSTLTVMELKGLADNGSRDALSQLGKAYESGLQGAPVDLRTSLDFYKRASDLGDGSASLRIGAIYFNGREGVPKDDVQAVRWYRKSADAGYAAGMATLGTLYERGIGGLPKDDVQAASWYRKAANAGDRRGMLFLGTMYEEGRGELPQDDAQTVSWYRKSADAGDDLGMAFLGLKYEQGRGGLPQDEAQALTWYRKSADAGNGLGMAFLGYMYELGQGGLSRDPAQAAAWYRKASDAGEPYGMYRLGSMYESGLGGLPKDEAQAVSWYRKAAQLGNSSAKDSLKRFGVGGAEKNSTVK